jgi:hypothetical protein
MTRTVPGAARPVEGAKGPINETSKPAITIVERHLARVEEAELDEIPVTSRLPVRAAYRSFPPFGGWLGAFLPFGAEDGIDERVGPLALEELVLQVVCFESHPDSLGDSCRRLVTGVDVSDDPV